VTRLLSIGGTSIAACLIAVSVFAADPGRPPLFFSEGWQALTF
jgi:hypothetical protein